MENHTTHLAINTTTNKLNTSPSTETKESIKHRLVNNARVVAFFTFLSRILGAVRDLVMLHVFGAGVVYDAFIIALTIPNVLRRLTAEGSLSMIFVPLYTEVREEQGKAAAQKFARKVASLLIIVCTLICALGIAYSAEIVQIFASGFDPDSEKFHLSVRLTQIMFPYLLFISLVALAMGILNSEQHFAAPAAAPILLNLFIITATLFFTDYFSYPIEAAAWAVTLAGVAQLLLQLPFLKQLGQPLAPANFLNDPQIKQLLRLMGPTLFGVAVYQINIIILRNLASNLPDGHVSYYNIASRLQELIIGVFAFAYATASLPEFSKHTSQSDWENAFSTLRTSISSAMFIVMPATAGFIAFALPVVSMLFLHGEFTWQDTQISAQALQFIAISIPALTLIRILVAIFFAMKDTRSPVIASTISVITTAALGWYLSPRYQVSGLVLALSLGVFIQAAALLLMLRIKKQQAFSCIPIVDVCKYMLLSTVIGGAVFFSVQFGDWQHGASKLTNWLVFISVILFSVFSYIALLYLVKDQNSRDMLTQISKRFAFSKK